MRLCVSGPPLARRFAFRFLAVLGVLVSIAPGANATLKLKVEDAKFNNGVKVSFLSLNAIQTRVSPQELSKMFAAETSDQSYTVFADIGAIKVYPAFEDYVFYVRDDSAAPNAELMKFTVQALPTGEFPDQQKNIWIDILDGKKKHQLQMLLPLHSRTGNFLMASAGLVQKVYVSGGQVTVQLINHYPLGIEITSATLSRLPSSYWLSQPKLTNKLPLYVGADQNDNYVTLLWTVQPRAWKVLFDSLIPLTKGSSQTSSGAMPGSGAGTSGGDAIDSLDFSIDYVPASGGFSHTIKVQQDVSFYPTLPLLLGVAALGALLAGLIMFFGVRKKSGARKFFKFAGLNIILALVVELIAIGLFSFQGSKIQIGILNLNPTLLIPAACLGAATVFSGYRQIEKWFGEAGPPAPIAARGAGS